MNKNIIIIKIFTIIGARPQFIKAAMFSRIVAKHAGFEEYIVHTGQHYDKKMSQVFFDEMKIPKPNINLKIGSGTHAEITGQMMIALEKEMLKEKPDIVLVYGDTNSTLAGALTTAKLNIPIAHIEAGLRSFNNSMPEEINRIITDRLSSLLFCPTKIAVENLSRENIKDGVFNVGDIMFDATLAFAESAKKTIVLEKYKLNSKEYILATLHRVENTDCKERLENILLAFAELAKSIKLILPLHPRTDKMIKHFNLNKYCSNLILIEPVSFLEIHKLEMNAKVIMTDSGGIQKEAYFHKTPCITLREETEWVETVNSGWNILTGANYIKILLAYENIKTGYDIIEYGDGNTASKILKEIFNYLQKGK